MFINIITRKLKRLADAFRVLPEYLAKTKKFHFKTVSSNSAIINLDKSLMDQSFGRFAFILCKYFEFAGLHVVIKTNLHYFSKMMVYKRLLLNQNYAFAINISTPINTIKIKIGNDYKTIRVFKGLEIDKTAFNYVAQFPLHPAIIQNFNVTDLKKLRTQQRKIRVFFAGNLEKNKYSSHQLERDFRVIPRYEIIQLLTETCSQIPEARVISKREELDQISTSNSRKQSMVISKVRTTDEDWLKFLGLSDFFIAPPGIAYPWCHNSIEAMAVGCIPILQYAHLFYPPLENMKNCLSFDNALELDRSVKRALSMSPDEVEKLRSNVTRYFEKYLSPTSIVNRIRRFTLSDQKEVQIAIPFIR